MTKRKPYASNYLEKNRYQRDLEEAADITSKPPSDIEADRQVDQVFEPEQQQEPNGGVGFLEKFWDSLTE